MFRGLSVFHVLRVVLLCVWVWGGSVTADATGMRAVWWHEIVSLEAFDPCCGCYDRHQVIYCDVVEVFVTVLHKGRCGSVRLLGTESKDGWICLPHAWRDQHDRKTIETTHTVYARR